MNTKVCRKCGVEKELDEFYTDRRVTDGRRAECKDCFCIAMRERNSTPEARKKRRAYRNRPGVLAKQRERCRVYRDVYKLERQQYAEVNRFKMAIYRAQHAAKQLGYSPCTATVEEVTAAFTGKCHVCGVPEVECTQRLCLDHDHETGAFRGFLCDNCNRVLGFVRDSADRMRALADYVERTEVRI
jgi:hypothetical protein